MVFQYADDFVIMSYHLDFDTALFNLKNKTEQFKRTCSKLNLSFNPEKCNTMYFAKNSIKEISLSIDGKPIIQQRKFTFLGRVITNSLTVRDHYEKTAFEINARTNMLKCLTPIKTGLHPKTALNIYKSLVRSKTEYARTTTANSPKYVNDKIQKIPNDMIKK